MTRSAAPPPDRFELFGQALDRLGQALVRRLGEQIAAVAEDLEAAGEAEPLARDRQALYAAAAMLRIDVRVRLERAGSGLHDRAHQCLEVAQRAGDENQALALMEENELRHQILAAEMARALRAAPGVKYADYAARVGALMPGLWQSDELNPLGARTLASGALDAFVDIGDASAVAGVLRRSMVARLAPALGPVIEDVRAWLADLGVAPGRAPAPGPARARATDAAAATPRASPGQASSAQVSSAQISPAQVSPAQVSSAQASSAQASSPQPSPHTPPPDTAPDEASDTAPDTAPSSAPPRPERALESSEQAAEAARVLGTSPLAGETGAARLPVVTTLQPVVELERDAVAFAHSIGALPYSREARAQFFGKVRVRLRAAGVPAAQGAVIDVVAAMFDYVVDDRRVPDPAKPLIWRLQQPAVALALLDPAYLGDDPRSLRRLVENIGAIVNAFSDDLSRGSELHRRLDTVVRAVEIVASALQTRSAVMARQVEHEYARAARNVSQLIERVVNERTALEAAPGRRNRRNYRNRPGREREVEVTERLGDLLRERLERHQVPESVREFVLNVWLRQLRTAVLRDGEDSAEFKVALQVVDDLLWSLDASKERQSRSELAQKIPPLIRLLTQGLREMGAKDDEHKPFFDELFLIHLRKMQRRRKGRGGSTAPGGAPDGDDDTGPSTRNGGPSTGGGTRRTGAGGDFDAPGAGAATIDRPPRSPAHGESLDDLGVPSTDRLPTLPDLSDAAPPTPGLPIGAPGTGADAGSPERADRKLMEILASLDLTDLPEDPRPFQLDADRALATLSRGDWLRLETRDGKPAYAKVAWINARRTVVLLVRHPDRRALSMRTEELRERFAQGRASRVG